MYAVCGINAWKDLVSQFDQASMRVFWNACDGLVSMDTANIACVVDQHA